MSTVMASVNFHCPLPRVQAYLREGVQAAVATGPKQSVVIACMPLNTGGNGPWLVTWEPESGGIYPAFEGRLSAHYNTAEDKTILELDGEYEPPIGNAGRYVTDTAREFLTDLAAEMRARYAYEQTLVSFGDPPDPSPA